jgi:hypothetical protein
VYFRRALRRIWADGGLLAKPPHALVAAKNVSGSLDLPGGWNWRLKQSDRFVEYGGTRTALYAYRQIDVIPAWYAASPRSKSLIKIEISLAHTVPRL